MYHRALPFTSNTGQGVRSCCSSEHPKVLESNWRVGDGCYWVCKGSGHLGYAKYPVLWVLLCLRRSDTESLERRR